MQSPGPVTIAPGVTMDLPFTRVPGRAVDAVQRVTAHYQDRTVVFEGRISATPERFLLVSLDTLGRRAMTVTWTAAGVHAEAAPWLPASVRAENMLADIVLIYWPEAAVRAALTGASLEVTAGRRSVRSRSGGEVVRIDYGTGVSGPWSGLLHLHNLAWGYGLDIQSQETRASEETRP